jgi:hypothetical protein
MAREIGTEEDSESSAHMEIDMHVRIGVSQSEEEMASTSEEAALEASES